MFDGGGLRIAYLVVLRWRGLALGLGGSRFAHASRRSGKYSESFA